MFLNGGKLHVLHSDANRSIHSGTMKLLKSPEEREIQISLKHKLSVFKAWLIILKLNVRLLLFWAFTAEFFLKVRQRNDTTTQAMKSLNKRKKDFSSTLTFTLNDRLPVRQLDFTTSWPSSRRPDFQEMTAFGIMTVCQELYWSMHSQHIIFMMQHLCYQGNCRHSWELMTVTGRSKMRLWVVVVFLDH